MYGISVYFPETAFDISVWGTLIIEKTAGSQAKRNGQKKGPQKQLTHIQVSICLTVKVTTFFNMPSQMHPRPKKFPSSKMACFKDSTPSTSHPILKNGAF
jgi:hypothetical protein